MTHVYSLSFAERRTYVAALLFVLGNIVLPQLAHLIPQGGLIFLPIYFFTLVGAYKFGWRVGLLTALGSPLVNNLLFGMPPTAMLPVIMVKSTLLALTAAAVAHRAQRVSLLLVALVVVTYQLLGSAFEWAWTGSLTAAVQDVRLGAPGLAIQIIGGYFAIKALDRL